MQKTASSCYRCKEAGQYGCPASSFLKMEHPVNEYLPIYAIVSSLAEMTSITRVQIMVNGSQDVMFREVVSLNTAFERNTDYIEQE